MGSAGLMRTIGVLTTGRADYGIVLPILKAIDADADLNLWLMVTGMHLSPEFGMSEVEIAKDGFKIKERVEILLSSDTPEGMAKSMGLAMLGFAQVFAQDPPDILLVVGDRFEVCAAVAAAVPFGIPIAHVHGGEVTEGAIDESFRHSITKMSHIHFATTNEYARRVAQMGEEDWRICVSGAPGLDNMLQIKAPTRGEVEDQFSIDLEQPILLATYHPVTRSQTSGQNQLTYLLAAIEDLGVQVVFTYPNADSGGRAMVSRIEEFQKRYVGARLVVNASQEFYIGLMKYVSAMVGNSSSGIIEAATFELPVVNIGPRQAGRIRAENVIDVDNTEKAIKKGLELALTQKFRCQLQGITNPYGVGRAGDKIMTVLKDIELNQALIYKRFVDLEQAAARV
jgi:GDP/UDP-N,N'-diacetylbacillosamine 2-epimerase (hydrolysing)